MARAMGFALGFAGVVLTGGTALAQRVKGIPIGGGDSDDGGAFAAIVLILGVIVLAGVLAIALAQMLVHGALHGFLWTMEGIFRVYDWFRPPAQVKKRRLEREHKLELEHLAKGRSHVREILRKKLPHFHAAQLEQVLDALKFTGYLRLPPGVSVKKYNPRRLGIDLDNQGPAGTIQVHLRYDGKMFIDVSVAPGDGISLAK